MIGRGVIVAAVAVYLSVLAWVIWPTGSPAGAGESSDPLRFTPNPVQVKLEGLPYRGVAVQIQNAELIETYKNDIDEVAKLGADTVSIVVAARQENGGSSRIFIDTRTAPTPEKLGELIDHAKSRKLRVLLMPIVLLENPRGNEWRGNIKPDLWEDWFDSYRNLMRHWAKVAQRHGVDVFSVGSELVSSEGKAGEWSKTIKEIRQIYRGQLTYSSNWDHYEKVPFWNQLDLIGMNSYWKLGENRNVSVDEVVSRWRAIQAALLSWQRAGGFGKPILLMEVGWCSVANAAHEPWDYTQMHHPVDLELQKKLYEGFFKAWHGHPNLGGFIVWEWSPGDGGPQNRGYTPEGKPAEAVLRQWLATPWKQAG